MNVLDTNVWLYNHDTREPHKQQLARQVISSTRPLALPWQVGCEFVAASRKLVSLGFTLDDAWDYLADMQTISSVLLLPVPDLWSEAESLQHRYSLSVWDALLVAACLRGGVRVLYTEDMGAPRTIDGLQLVNPFLALPTP